ncbi:MAG: DMT family transporter [Actinomycetia bacterium]|nr:DMT family transporter [Actinomycetes bacterium]MCP3913300.1 DMT family transporter [Actinomycetes bacterium]MCP4086130.1 DMT family transporter [Actinomycetes bacterium]
MPALFVFMWSTGFIGAKYGLPDAGPMTFLGLRFLIVISGLGLAALVFRAPWPRGREIMHAAIVGLLLHAVYLGGVFSSIDAGVDAAVSALIVGIQPILTALVSGPVLGERVTSRQWFGLALGLVGVALVVWIKLDDGGTVGGMAFSFLALLGVTAGTIWQKRFCGTLDIRTSGVVQFVAASVPILVLAVVVERWDVVYTRDFVFAVAWLVIVLSFGAITLLAMLLRRGSASRTASLFYLVPASTAALAWLLFDEEFGPLTVLGMGVAMAGVAIVNRAPAPIER